MTIVQYGNGVHSSKGVVMPKRVYFAHSMEGKSIPAESGQRGRAVRELLGAKFQILLAEEWQARISFNTIEEEDIKQLESASIILADLYDVGLKSKDGNTIMCIGTNQEIGYAKAKGKYVVIIGRQPVHVHPFNVGKYVDYYATSLEEACNHIREKFNEKKN